MNGIHHITVIAGDPRENLDFYVRVLGMRLVKKSVNQDAPDTYHLFYADGVGSPGTDLTFFPWPDAAPGVLGIGLTVEVQLAVARGSLEWWSARLAANRGNPGAIETRFGARVLPFADPHGLALALVEADRPFVPWPESPVPMEHQVRGLHAARLWERQLEPTASFLVDVMGFRSTGEEGGWHRYAAEGGGSGTLVEIREMPGERRSEWGVGTVHHVAWRVADVAEQDALRARVERAGRRPTPRIDRYWFESVYFREPGGVLFELATDGPGFERDEPVAHLGERLILPPWMEPHRREIEATLPPLEAPTLPER